MNDFIIVRNNNIKIDLEGVTLSRKTPTFVSTSLNEEVFSFSGSCANTFINKYNCNTDFICDVYLGGLLYLEGLTLIIENFNKEVVNFRITEKSNDFYTFVDTFSISEIFGNDTLERYPDAKPSSQSGVLIMNTYARYMYMIYNNFPQKWYNFTQCVPHFDVYFTTLFFCNKVNKTLTLNTEEVSVDDLREKFFNAKNNKGSEQGEDIPSTLFSSNPYFTYNMATGTIRVISRYDLPLERQYISGTSGNFTSDLTLQELRTTCLPSCKFEVNCKLNISGSVRMVANTGSPEEVTLTAVIDVAVGSQTFSFPIQGKVVRAYQTYESVSVSFSETFDYSFIANSWKIVPSVIVPRATALSTTCNEVRFQQSTNDNIRVRFQGLTSRVVSDTPIGLKMYTKNLFPFDSWSSYFKAIENACNVKFTLKGDEIVVNSKLFNYKGADVANYAEDISNNILEISSELTPIRQLTNGLFADVTFKSREVYGTTYQAVARFRMPSYTNKQYTLVNNSIALVNEEAKVLTTTSGYFIVKNIGEMEEYDDVKPISNLPLYFARTTSGGATQYKSLYYLNENINVMNNLGYLPITNGIAFPINDYKNTYYTEMTNHNFSNDYEVKVKVLGNYLNTRLVVLQQHSAIFLVKESYYKDNATTLTLQLYKYI